MELERTRIDLHEYWQVIHRRKVLLILPFIIAVGTALIGSLFMDPVYQASTSVLLGERPLPMRSIQGIVSDQPSRRGAFASWGGIGGLRSQIQSRDYMREMANRLGLMDNESLFQRAREAQAKYADLTVEEIMEEWLIASLRSGIKVDGQTENIIKITYRSTSPEIAYQRAKTLAQIFIDESLRSQLVGIRGALDFSTDQLSLYKERLDESERKLERFKQGVVEDQVDDYTITSANMKQINSIIQSTELELQEVEDRFEALEAQLRATELGTISLSLSFELEDQLFAAVDQLPDLLAQYSWMDSKVMWLNDKINTILGNAKAEIRSKAASYASVPSSTFDLFVQREIAKLDRAFLGRKRNTLANFVNRYKSSLAERPSRETILARLEEEVEANRKIYNMFLQQAQSSQIDEALKRTEAEYKFKIIEPARRPLKPVEPDRVKLLIMACLLGSMLGFGLIVLTEFLDHSFRKVEEVENYISLPVLGTIPKIGFPRTEQRSRGALALKIAILLVVLGVSLFFIGREVIF